MFEKCNIFRFFRSKKNNIIFYQDELNKTNHNQVLIDLKEENKKNNEDFCINIFDFCYHSNYSKRIHFNSDYLLE